MPDQSANPSPKSRAIAAGGISVGVASSGAMGSGVGSSSQLSKSNISRAGFDAFELATVLSHYDVGVIQGLHEFRRGSTRSPKVVLKSERGVYLLKRRAPGRDNELKVAFCHGVQLHLAARRFPLARLIGDRRSNNSLVVHEKSIYELFEYVPGNSYDGSIPSTRAAGRALAQFHKCLADHRPTWTPRSGGYHNEAKVLPHLDRIPEKLGLSEGDGAHCCEALHSAYARAADHAREAGLADWPAQVIHGDWHPGNMLFQANGEIAAVVDFDAARVEPRALDLANGALQFSIVRQGENPEDWQDNLDEDRLQAFCRGYDEVEGCTISLAEINLLPWLMIEALIVEVVVPIAATGSFGQLEGLGFLRMVQRKVAWIEEHARRLTDLIR